MYWMRSLFLCLLGSTFAALVLVTTASAQGSDPAAEAPAEAGDQAPSPAPQAQAAPSDSGTAEEDATLPPPPGPPEPGREIWDRLGHPFQVGFVLGYTEAATFSAERDPRGYFRTRMPRWEGDKVKIRDWLEAVNEFSKTPYGQIARPRNMVNGAIPILIEKFGRPPTDMERFMQRQMKAQGIEPKDYGLSPTGKPLEPRVRTPEEVREARIAQIQAEADKYERRVASYPKRLKHLEKRRERWSTRLAEIQEALAAEKAKPLAADPE